jgi:membrane protease YdiL (CAAX protease family)
VDAVATRDPKVATLGVVSELLVFGAGMLLGTLVVGGLFAIHVLPRPQENLWTLVIAGPIIMFTCAALYTAVDKGGIPALPHAYPAERGRPIRKPVSVGRAWVEVAAHVPLALGGAVLIGLGLDAMGFPVEEQGQIQDIVAGGWSLDLVMLGLAALVLAPIFEEWLFRHMLFRRLHHVAGPAAAFILSAILFAAAHFNPSGVLTYTWLACIFALVYRRTGRVWAPMVVHAVNNGVTLALLVSGF